eukprot:GILK01004140.1.p1 GENE.GILK01004140.1~~GILK01004140.1.p1  ORF type:complete len:194 (+),score=19.85 GILK01004140.1:77-658(+)
MERKCRRAGCQLPYSDATIENCRYHDGKPLFHDGKKLWTCCNQSAYDWDDFTKLQGCKTGRHSDVAECTGIAPSPNAPDLRSDAPAPAPRMKTADDFNREEEERLRALAAAKAAATQEKKIQVLANGNYRCSNKGCLKEYAPDSTEECRYHPGAPIFHDGKKGWSCCGGNSWDWDEFMKLPTCAVGQHVPKMV